MLAGPHPRSLSLGGYAPRSGRRRLKNDALMLAPSLIVLANRSGVCGIDEVCEDMGARAAIL